jgi:hypothetical protein
MADGFDDVYVDTRRQLRGVAESLIAGPQYRASGTIRLAVRPDGVYDIVDPLPADAVLNLDVAVAEWIHRSHYAGGHAIKNVLPEQHPVLWPEHFDVAATDNEVNYGVSAGDDYHPTPYAYVGPWTQRTGPFWKAPFGAICPLAPADDVDALTSRIADFFERARLELSK